MPEDSPEAKDWLASQKNFKDTQAFQTLTLPPTEAVVRTSYHPNLPIDGTATESVAQLAASPINSSKDVTTTPPHTSGSSPSGPPALPLPLSLQSVPRVSSTSSISSYTSKLTVSHPSSSTVPRSPPKPRAKSGGLSALNKNKPKKLSTLEKSRLDWSSHVEDVGKDMKDELEANRKSGGYIEKMEFLGRVEERVERRGDEERGGKRKR